MQIGLIGLGRMGANMSRRWLQAGHSVVGYARHAETVDGLLADSAIAAGAASVKDLVNQLTPPRVLWLMVPAASVDSALDELVPLWPATTWLLTAATPTTSTTSGGRRRSRSWASTTWTAGPAAASRAWRAAIA